MLNGKRPDKFRIISGTITEDGDKISSDEIVDYKKAKHEYPQFARLWTPRKYLNEVEYFHIRIEWKATFLEISLE